ncbi:MAG: hypothetical protein V3R93_05560, partial [Candidatus Hydrothermarchaeaceae archaeon]
MDTELNSIKANWWEMGKQTKGLKETIEVKDGIIAAKDKTIKDLIEKSRKAVAEPDMFKNQVVDSTVTEDMMAEEAQTPPATEKAIEPPTFKPETPAPKVSPNDSKIKLLEIKRRSILKMLDRSGVKDSSLGKKYQATLDELSLEIKELRQG